jgi:alginate export protein
MESNRRVVCLEPRKVEHGVVLNVVTTNSCGSDQHRFRRRCVAVIAGLALQSLFIGYGAHSASAQAEKADVELKRPALQIGSALRFNEDWSVLKGVDTSKTDDFWDRVKFIPLTPDQNVWLSIGGQVRERGEYFDQFQFGASAPKRSDGYLLSRFRLNADLHVTPYFRIYTEGKVALATDRELQGRNSTGFYDQADLFNGFADIMIPFGKQANVTLRGGRQELLFGSQRLVGPGDFTQVPHTFDGAQAIVRIADWTVTPFWTQAVIVDKYKFDKSSPDRQFYGLYTTAPAHLLPMNLDLYYLGANNRTAAFNSTTGRENRHTLGLRTWGKIGQTNWDFDLEGAGQFGTVGSASIRAGMFTAVLGYTLPVKEWSPRAYIEFDYASGDKSPGGKVGTFNQLFPNGHSYLGYIDYIGRQNIISPNAGIAITPIRDLTLTLQQYLFWRASDRDGIFNKSSAVLRPGTGTRALYVGAETDLLATYNFTRHLQGYAGYSFFSTGGFIKKTGRDSNSQFVYAALQYTF